MSKVSIIIPIYNVEKYLKQCLDSVVNQTLKDIEIICVDDGSTDNSGKILDDYAACDNRIKVIHKENGGYGKAMNIGLDNAVGEYIGIVEPDDYIDENMYEDLYSIAEKNNSDIVKSSFYVNRISSQDTRIFKAFGWDGVVPKTTFTLDDCPQFLCSHPSIWSSIYKTEFLKLNGVRFIEATGAGWTDNPFQVEVMHIAKRINYTNNAYYYWRQEAANDSEALKNYKLPFDRAEDIYNVLSKYNITNPKILEALYKTQLTHIRIVLGVKKVNLIDCSIKIQKLCKRMNQEIIHNSGFLTKEDLAIYKMGKSHPLLMLVKYRYFNKFNFFKKEKTKTHIIIHVLGIKVKFKIKSSKQQSQIEKLEKRVTKIEKELNKIRNKIYVKN